MTRLIVFSFAALGWCFYVMSGGPDFEPRGLRSDKPQPVAVARSTTVAPARAEELVTNVAARVSTVPIEPRPEPEEVVEFVTEEASLGSFSSLTVFADQSASIT
ncbi:MAG: hypothetical protein ACWA49_04510, partial [Ruegeria sp.]